MYSRNRLARGNLVYVYFGEQLNVLFFVTLIIIMISTRLASVQEYKTTKYCRFDRHFIVNV